MVNETALATYIAYVDLNPIRAAIAKIPEDSHYTSIKVSAEAYAGLFCAYHVSKKNFKDRRQWIVDRLFVLSECFSIDLRSYNVMEQPLTFPAND